MQTKAIIIKKQNTGEYDQWLTCYTEDFGKLKVVAKSILKPSSIQALHLDIFNLVEFDLVTGKGMSIVTGAQAINFFSKIKSSPVKTAVAYFFSEVLDKIVFENEKDSDLWTVLISLLNKLNNMDASPVGVLRDYQTKMLDVLGYFPEAHFCKMCGRKLEEINIGAFCYVLGGVICGDCFISGSGGVLISKDDFGLLNRSGDFYDRAIYRRSILDAVFENVSGGKFYSLELLSMVK